MGTGSHHRDAQAAGEQGQMDMDVSAPGFVHQVYADNDPGGDLQDLKNQIQVTFQAGGVTDCNDHIRLTETEKIPGSFFLGGVRFQGVCAGKIHKHIILPFKTEMPLCFGHGLARPVACMLVHAGEGVENAAFSHIGITRQCDDPGGLRYGGTAAI